MTWRSLFPDRASAQRYLDAIADPAVRARTAQGLNLPEQTRGPGESNGFPSEAAFQAAAVSALELRGWEVHESFKGTARGGSVWMTKGFPDLMVYRSPRRLWFAELKQPGNRPSEDQLAYHSRLRAAGFRVVVVWTLGELLTVADEEAS